MEPQVLQLLFYVLSLVRQFVARLKGQRIAKVDDKEEEEQKEEMRGGKSGN